ncbi:interleukin-5 receptor subunit alpha-like isoform X2 [Pyxicephalus adspersus]|uniref:interleukin-5 receptor subunit alpha-like isoform X2 n=1 Tax=Pyxicephalus adspersus TaxID=30357 RepID=UPI003B5C6C32
MEEILTDNFRIVHHRLHPGFIASVSYALCKKSLIVFEGNKTEYLYHFPPVYLTNVSCTIYNVTNLNCTWEWIEDTPPDANYSFALSLYDKTVTCKQYLKWHGKNTGCHMKNVLPKENKYEISKIMIWFSNNSTSFYKTFRAHKIELLNAPVNISVTSVNGSTKLEWLSPPSVNPLSPNCFQYHIRVLETQTKQLFKNIIGITTQEYIFSDLDKDKNFSMQIRAKKIYCADSKYWGEWSQMIFIHKDKEIYPIWIIIWIIVITSVVVMFLLLYLLRRYVKKLILVAVPGPSKKIKSSLSSNNINAQRCIAVHNEQPVPITEIEIVNCLMDSLESQDLNSNNI